MTKRKQQKVNLDKKREMSTEEITERTGEGGIGAYNYNDFSKKASLRREKRSQEASEMIEEDDLKSRLNYIEETIPNFNKEYKDKLNKLKIIKSFNYHFVIIEAFFVSYFLDVTSTNNFIIV